MQMKGIKNHLSIIELWRFIASIIIMTHHLFGLGIEKYPFKNGSIYVEFFFILTGYFTMKHFEKYTVDSIDEAFKNSMQYTIKKFKSFMPYVLVSVPLLYFILYFEGFQFNIKRFLQLFSNALSEIMLLSSITGTRVVGNIWFLSATIIVFPIFCIICQLKQKYLVKFLAVYIPLIYYSIYSVGAGTKPPTNLARTLACLLLGVLVYFFANYLKEKTFTAGQRILLTFMEQGSLILACACSFYGIAINLLYLYLFMIGIAIMVSQQSYTYKVGSKVLLWLGDISVWVFVCHNIVMKFITSRLDYLNINDKVGLYYAGTFVSAIVFDLVVKYMIKRFQSRRK